MALALVSIFLFSQPALALTTAQKEAAAIAFGKQISNNHCTGTAKPPLTNSPMRSADFPFMIPYGLMVGGHVTPIDHQYFAPTDASLGRDSYVVRAAATSRIVDIGTRPSGNHISPGVEYRIVFSISCKLHYYYDLVTSLTPGLKQVYDAHVKYGKAINVPVKAGWAIGRIGGQTLDFAVWDSDVIVPGFIVPSHYSGETWKIHTADPLKYSTLTLRSFFLSKYMRTAHPVSGRIDYDIDGRLIGTWFVAGTGGYTGLKATSSTYSMTHLSFAPNWWDPSKFIISIGSWPPDANQFAILDNKPDPGWITQANGLVKYNLVNYFFVDGHGNMWDSTHRVSTPIRLVAGTDIQGCLLAQLTAARKLKVQTFPGKICDHVHGFTSAAVMYER